MAELVRDQIITAADAANLAARMAAASAKTASLPTHARAGILSGIADRLEKESEAFARLICEEVKKPMKDARKEVARAVFTFRWAAEEVKRFGGELLPLDLDAASEGRVALTKRFSRGPALLITPFNFPLNLVAHKVAPAIAVGAPFVLKPAPQAPRTALKLAQAIKDAGWPSESMAVVNCPVEAAEALVRDDRFGVLSFTGSAKVGWHLKSVAGKKHVVLELGGNAGAFIAADADLPWAAARCAWGAYYYSGQVCISVQRILVEKSVAKEFRELLLANIAELKVGDPSKDDTDLGPLIDAKSADRVQAWIDEAVQGGATVLAGGKRDGDTIPATLVENAPASCKLSCEEAFGPVATLEVVDSKERAFDLLASGSYGLQAGLFTNDLRSVLAAWGRIPVGGLIVNDIPAYRSDAMPYGGVKDSGTGREGVRYAMEEFTEVRTLVLKP